MIGADLDQSLEDYMNMDSDTAEIFADFNLFMNGIVFEIGYRLSLSREEKVVVISRETLSGAKNENGIRTNKTVFMDYKRDQTNTIFKPQKRLDEILEENKDIKTDLIVARKMAEKATALIFLVRVVGIYSAENTKMDFNNFQLLFLLCLNLL